MSIYLSLLLTLYVHICTSVPRLSNMFTYLFILQLFHDDPEFTITVFCAVQLVGLTSTCTNPVLYAFFNENLRKEFEFLIECICPSVFSKATRLAAGNNEPIRSQLPNCVSYNLNNCRGKTEPKELRPRRDDNGVFPSIDVDLDPTFQKETGENEGCDCFENVEGEDDIELAPLNSNEHSTENPVSK